MLREIDSQVQMWLDWIRVDAWLRLVTLSWAAVEQEPCSRHTVENSVDEQKIVWLEDRTCSESWLAK